MNSAARLGFSSSRGDHDSDSLLKGALALSIHNKTLSRRIIYALFSHRGSIPRLRWGTFVPRCLICSLLEKNPAGARAEAKAKAKVWSKTKLSELRAET